MQSPTYRVPVVRLHKWPIQVADLTEIARSIGPKRRPRPITERQRHAHTRVRTFRVSRAMREIHSAFASAARSIMTQLVLQYDE